MRNPIAALMVFATFFGSVALASCNNDDVGTNPLAKSILDVRNLRQDTLRSIRWGNCALQQLPTANMLEYRGSVLPIYPQQTRTFAVDSGCYDAQFLDVRDSVVDARVGMRVAPGDTMIVVLRTSGL